MARTPDPWVRSYLFRIGEAFPADDRFARYVMRLSIALGDLRIAARYATRTRQRFDERLYFMRLTSSHLRELVAILDPPDTRFVPTVDQFVLSLPRGVKPSRAEIRNSHKQAMRQVEAVMRRRPDIEVNGKTRPPKLRDDLKELRNGFFHYGHNEPGDDALRAAMSAVAGDRSSYVMRAQSKRARYADVVGVRLAVPFDMAFARDFLDQTMELIGAVNSYVRQAEDAWLSTRPPGVVTVTQPGERFLLRPPPSA